MRGYIVYLRKKLLGRRVVIYTRKVYPIEGVNSNLKNDMHVTMIDCDSASLDEVIAEVKRLQRIFRLSDCSICNTGRENSYHLYFWTRVTWRKAIEIASACKYLDLKHLAFSLRRNHFTLRISNKRESRIEEIIRIYSSFLPDCSHKDFISFVKYETGVRI